MSEITHEKTHSLLEKLAVYVMNEVPRKEEVPTKHDLNVAIQAIQTALDQKADKKDVEKLEGKVDTLIDGMDKQAQQLDIIRTEQLAFNHGFNRLEKRVEKLEQAH
jgi:hypothetical protein